MLKKKRQVKQSFWNEVFNVKLMLNIYTIYIINSNFYYEMNIIIIIMNKIRIRNNKNKRLDYINNYY